MDESGPNLWQSLRKDFSDSDEDIPSEWRDRAARQRDIVESDPDTAASWGIQGGLGNQQRSDEENNPSR